MARRKSTKKQSRSRTSKASKNSLAVLMLVLILVWSIGITTIYFTPNPASYEPNHIPEKYNFMLNIYHKQQEK